MEKKDKIFIGIDVSKSSLDISFNGKHSKIQNTFEAISSFIKDDIADIKITLCVLESTGGYEKLVTKVFQESGIPVHRVHPNVIKSFGRASKYFAKTDKIDARLLEKYALFVSEEQLGDEPISDIQEALKGLRSLECNLEQSLHMYQCSIKHLTGQARKYAEEHIDHIKAQLQAIDTDIANIIKSDKDIIRKVEIMQSLKGIGFKTARVLITELPELGKISKKEIASLVGVAPKTNESGNKVFKGHIYGGRFFARKALYMPALGAIRYGTPMSAIYNRLIDAGKPAKVALVAVMRKILVCLNAMVKNNEIYS